MTIVDLDNRWEEFNNIVSFENEGLKNQFHNWGKGTKVVKIVDWFNNSLSDVFFENLFSLAILKLIWEEFDDIPTNSDDEIEEDFYCWKKGTDRFEIWHWFDEKLPNGVVVDFNLV